MVASAEEESGGGPSPRRPEARDPAFPDLQAMRAKFIADFTGGLIGQHHNTFQHRERVLRQLTAQARLRGH
jgi:hypothetical protein